MSDFIGLALDDCYNRFGVVGATKLPTRTFWCVTFDTGEFLIFRGLVHCKIRFRKTIRAIHRGTLTFFYFFVNSALKTLSCSSTAVFPLSFHSYALFFRMPLL